MLETAEQLASIATAVVAVVAYGNFLLGRRDRRRRLERHFLALRRANAQGYNVRSLQQLMLELKMTESEVYEAAFNSKLIKAEVSVQPGSHTLNTTLFQLDS